MSFINQFVNMLLLIVSMGASMGVILFIVNKFKVESLFLLGSIMFGLFTPLTLVILYCLNEIKN